MINNTDELYSIQPPFGANGGSGGGGGSGSGGSGGTGSGDTSSQIVLKKETLPNTASGHFFRQEAVLHYGETGAGKTIQQTTWFRSFYQGLHSGYRWIVPVAPVPHYTLVSNDIFANLERKLHLTSEPVFESPLYNLNLLKTRNEVLDWIDGFDFDLDSSVIDRYLDQNWAFVGSQVFATLFNDDPFYRIVNSTPLKVTTWEQVDGLRYPLAVTGSTLNAEVTKTTEIRLYIVTRYYLLKIPEGFTTVFRGYVEHEYQKQFVTVIEGTLAGDQMDDDIFIPIDRNRESYE